MQFRTEIGIKPCNELKIGHADNIFMLGSCFTDNIGACLERDGFSLTRNPMGPLYNPCSITNALRLMLNPAREVDLRQDEAGTWHCLDFASRYASADAQALRRRVGEELDGAGEALRSASVVIITLGSAFVYRWGGEQGEVVGNCHKFKPQCFSRSMLSAEAIRAEIEAIINMLKDKRLIFTISPIRHLADGLHGNQLSKAALQLGLDGALQGTDCLYFPAYEIMIDDLRDYRFYAADMKHPSDVAIEYIYQCFATAYFTPATIAAAAESRALWKRSAHIPLAER